MSYRGQFDTIKKEGFTPPDFKTRYSKRKLQGLVNRADHAKKMWEEAEEELDLYITKKAGLLASVDSSAFSNPKEAKL